MKTIISSFILYFLYAATLLVLITSCRNDDSYITDDSEDIEDAEDLTT
ncbi:hypothetical protein [Aquimarina pacifica]|nr:hypothetical protein [Aquimarina pacifica]